MDLLKSVLGGLAAAAQGNAGQAQAPAAGGVDLAALAPVLMELLAGKGGGAGAAGGGLGGLVEQLSRGGLGDAVQSWISRGQNMPVSGNQLESALGSDVLGQLGGRLGVDGAQMGNVQGVDAVGGNGGIGRDRAGFSSFTALTGSRHRGGNRGCCGTLGRGFRRARLGGTCDKYARRDQNGGADTGPEFRSEAGHGKGLS